MNVNTGWIAVDLDGTLAHYGGWQAVDQIGEPIPEMLKRVKAWLKADIDVRIFTARVGTQKNIEDVEKSRKAIIAWCIKHIGYPIPITATKDYLMVALYDDRCVQVEPNTGRIIGDESWLFPSQPKKEG